MWAGVDVGDRRKGFHSVVVDDRGVVEGPFRLGRPADVVRWLRRFEPALVAVDSPCSAANDGERFRACERRVRAEVCGIRWTPDREGLAANPRYYGWVLYGFELYAALEKGGHHAVECFPTASWTRWAGPRGSRSRAAWTRDALTALGLQNVPAQTNQDMRDAIAAAVTAREHCLGGTALFGEIAVPGTARSEAPGRGSVDGVADPDFRTPEIGGLRRF